MAEKTTQPATERDWYKDALIYELHVRAFADSNGDGIGDFRGLIDKLDYLQDLGVTALWLLPFYPSPLRDDGYDIADYHNVHPSYGTLADFKAFLKQAHKRGLRVITELVINHTSDQHPWFQRARRAAPGTPHRDFYVWSDTPTRYADARIIFQDFETSNWSWDPVAQAYYWHRFYSHQPDLNFEHPEVRRAVVEAMEFWLDMGVDGLRLDAIPYLYEREGTNCENLPETHAFLRELRRHIDERYGDRMLLAEANQWPEDAVAYFGQGDECQMAFHFPVMPRLFMALRMETRYPIVEILQQTPPIPEGCQWAIFLRNHDELTLEMVTDEDRDYMYRVYAGDVRARINLGIRRRLAPLLGNDRRRIELMNALLFSLPGTPVLYYGDEIGMGDNIYLGDRNGVRTPMQWSADRNAGFSRANAQRLYLPITIDPEYHYEAVNVEAQQGNAHSLLWWNKRLIAWRKRYRAFGRGSFEFILPENHHVIAFVRRLESTEQQGGECILVVANLSRFAQHVELDLSAFAGTVPVELFGRTTFPPVGNSSYNLTLGPHSFYWFALEARPELAVERAETNAPVILLNEGWDSLWHGPGRDALEAALLTPLQRQSHLPARALDRVHLVDEVPLGNAQLLSLALVRTDPAEADMDLIPLWVAQAQGKAASAVEAERPVSVIAHLRRLDQPEERVLFQGLQDPHFWTLILDSIMRHRRFRGMEGDLTVSSTGSLSSRLAPLVNGPAPAKLDFPEPRSLHPHRAVFGDQVAIELFARLQEGINPELEMRRFLQERTEFGALPSLLGWLEYRARRGGTYIVGLLESFTSVQGSAWGLALESLDRYFERELAEAGELDTPRFSGSTLLAYAAEEIPTEVNGQIGSFLAWAHSMGDQSARLVLALASSSEDPAFAPEPFTPFYQRSLYQTAHSLLHQALDLLSRQQDTLPDQARPLSRQLLSLQEMAGLRLRSIYQDRVRALRVRVPGEYNLHSLGFTGKDLVLMDLGAPDRPPTERRIKRSPVRDAASFLYSIGKAAFAGCVAYQARTGDQARLVRLRDHWGFWSGVAFLQGYMHALESAEPRPIPLWPATASARAVFLDFFLAKTAVEDLWDGLNGPIQETPRPLEFLLAGVLRDQA